MPERAIFRIAAALASGPKLLLMMLLLNLFGLKSLPNARQHRVARMVARALAPMAFGVSFLRCLSCGFWVYVGSGENLHVHQSAFAAYAVISVFEKLILVAQTSIALKAHSGDAASRSRWWCSLIFKAGFMTLYLVSLGSGLPFLYQHNVYRIVGGNAQSHIGTAAVAAAKLSISLCMLLLSLSLFDVRTDRVVGSLFRTCV